MKSIGEFLLEITLLHVVIFYTIVFFLFIALAYKKPSWYSNAVRIFIFIIVFAYIYRLGWQASIEHHHVIRVNQSNIPNDFIGMFSLLVLIEVFWLKKVAKNRLEEVKEETEVKE